MDEVSAGGGAKYLREAGSNELLVMNGNPDFEDSART
jgi:hypothetical protein